MKYSLIYGIAIRNWYPNKQRSSFSKPMTQLLYGIRNNQPVNIGEIIFSQIVKHGDSDNVNHPIGFPSLIYDQVMKKDPWLMVNENDLSIGPKFIYAEHKLFTGKYKNDLVLEKPFRWVHEDVPSSSSPASASLSSSMRAKILCQLNK